MTLTPQNIISAVKLAGVVGCGGGGFPAHLKLESKVDTVIANGSECEPLLATDKLALLQKPEKILTGLKLAMKATSAKRGIVALKDSPKIVAALRQALNNYSDIELKILDNFYPAGDEFLLVTEATGRIVPEGGLPLKVGVLVHNVVTLWQIAQAVNGQAVTQRPVTIGGAVKKPQVVEVPIGTSYAALVNYAGGPNVENPVVLDGGPMMGKIIENQNEGIAKTTAGVLVLPADHFIVNMKRRTLRQELQLSRSACCQCFRCTDLCPRNLIGHNLHPHLSMRSVDYNLAEPAASITSAFLCSQCGICELAACDIMRLSPRRILAEYRKRLIAQGLTNPHKNQPSQTNFAYPYRKMPLDTLIKKIGVGSYQVEPAYGGKIAASQVRLPLKKGAGALLLPTVKKNEAVKLGEVVAKSPKEPVANYCHASISGTVTEVNEEFVEISQ